MESRCTRWISHRFDGTPFSLAFLMKHTVRAYYIYIYFKYQITCRYVCMCECMFEQVCGWVSAWLSKFVGRQAVR